ncbi:hypothetical protein BHM03_00020178 [Ensete ventricosum]|nr:hypothetical protein BHM03_00020178 [Ensete ventricosum]
MLVSKTRFSIPICTAIPGGTYRSAKLPVCGPLAIGRYCQNQSSMVDFGRRWSIEGEIDRQRLIEGEKGKKKKKKRRRTPRVVLACALTRGRFDHSAPASAPVTGMKQSAAPAPAPASQHSTAHAKAPLSFPAPLSATKHSLAPHGNRNPPMPASHKPPASPSPEAQSPSESLTNNKSPDKAPSNLLAPYSCKFIFQL